MSEFAGRFLQDLTIQDIVENYISSNNELQIEFTYLFMGLVKSFGDKAIPGIAVTMAKYVTKNLINNIQEANNPTSTISGLIYVTMQDVDWEKIAKDFCEMILKGETL